MRRLLWAWSSLPLLLFSSCIDPARSGAILPPNDDIVVQGQAGASGVSDVTTPPDMNKKEEPLTLTQPLENVAVSSPSINLSGSCAEDTLVEVSGDLDAPASSACPGGMFSVAVVLSTGNGLKTLTLTQGDNRVVLHVRLWIPPSAVPIVLASPAENVVVQTPSVSVKGSCSSGIEVLVSGDRLSPPSTPCVDGHFDVSIALTTQNNQTKTLSFSQSAPSGLQTATRNVVLSIPVPMSISAPAENAVIQAQSVAVQGSCASALPITIGGDRSGPVTATCTNGAFNVTVTLTAQNNQAKTLTFSQSALSGMQTITRHVVLSIPVAVSISAPAESVTVSNPQVSFSGACASDVSVDIGGDKSAPSSTSCVNGGFSVVVALSAGNGAKTVTVSQTTASGTQSATRHLTLAVPAPGPCDGGPYSSSAALPAAGQRAATRLISSGLKGAEGPVWHAGRGVLFFSDIQRDNPNWGSAASSRILRLTPPSSLDVFVTQSGSNGLALSADGRIIAATHSSHGLVAYDSGSAAATPLVSMSGTSNFNSPNDVVVRSDGMIYFTDPDWQRASDNAGTGATTGVYRVSGGNVSTVDTGLMQPNGISLSVNEKKLYVTSLADGGGAGIVTAYDVATNGSTSNPTPLISGVTWPDGMAIDCANNIYLATSSGVQVFDASGAALGTITLPKPDGSTTGGSNAVFGGADYRTLYITNDNYLFSIRINVPGLPRN